MSILLYRVDKRLIHGQVIVSCTKTLHPNEIVVANDEAVNDEFQKTLLQFAAPKETRLYILSIEDATKNILENKFNRALVILKDPKDVLRLLENGVKMEELNIGGMYHEPNKIQYAKALFLNEDDIKNLKSIKEKGVKTYYQVSLQDPKEDIEKLIKTE